MAAVVAAVVLAACADARPAAVAPAGGRRLADPVGYVGLTFDDGPYPNRTPRLLDLLKRYEAEATFFVTGRQVRLHPAVVRRAWHEGHQIGNHTYDHFRLPDHDPKQVWRQLRGTTEELQRLGIDPIFWRPPHGATTAAINEIATSERLRLVLWDPSSDPADWRHAETRWAEGDDEHWRGKPADQVCELVVAGARAGSIVLLHDWNAGTVEALPCIVEGLRARGLEPGALAPAADPQAQNGGSLASVVR